MKLDFDVIVPAAKAGDKPARDKLMEAFYGWSVTQAKTVIRDSDAAKDVAVDFWSWLFSEGGLNQFDPAKGNFYSWMQVCIKRRAKDAAKRRKPDVAYFSEVNDTEDFTPGEDSLLSGLQDLQAIADQLRNPTQKDVFWRMIEGATVEDIAQELGLSEKRVQNAIGEVRELIRATIGE